MRLPSARTPSDPDDARIGALAAGLTLGGHALVLFAALLLGGREVATIAVQNAVSVTLVGGGAQGSGGAADAAATPAKTPRPTPPTPKPAKADAETSGERLDQLLAPPAKPSATAPASQSAAKGGAATPSSSAATAANATGAAGSSRAGQGLGPGEGAEGVDLYAGASLPDVGRRSADPAGDLWRQVSACWRPAAPRRAALLVELSPDGRLTASPQAVRRQGAAVDPQTLLAERAALRALQACAPYPGLGGKRWRVEFP